MIRQALNESKGDDRLQREVNYLVGRHHIGVYTQPPQIGDFSDVKQVNESFASKP